MSNHDTVPLSYSDAVSELDEIVEALENQNVSIDDLESKVKRAAVLILFCKQKLKNTEEAIQGTIQQLQETPSQKGNGVDESIESSGEDLPF
jgi:exodeoxyribonuclease VII small subunit